MKTVDYCPGHELQGVWRMKISFAICWVHDNKLEKKFSASLNLYLKVSSFFGPMIVSLDYRLGLFLYLAQ